MGVRSRVSLSPPLLCRLGQGAFGADSLEQSGIGFFHSFIPCPTLTARHIDRLTPRTHFQEPSIVCPFPQGFAWRKRGCQWIGAIVPAAAMSTPSCSSRLVPPGPPRPRCRPPRRSARYAPSVTSASSGRWTPRRTPACGVASPRKSAGPCAAVRAGRFASPDRERATAPPHTSLPLARVVPFLREL